MPEKPTSKLSLWKQFTNILKAIDNSLPDISPFPARSQDGEMKLLIHGVVVSISTKKKQTP